MLPVCYNYLVFVIVLDNFSTDVIALAFTNFCFCVRYYIFLLLLFYVFSGYYLLRLLEKHCLPQSVQLCLVLFHSFVLTVGHLLICLNTVKCSHFCYIGWKYSLWVIMSLCPCMSYLWEISNSDTLLVFVIFKSRKLMLSLFCF